MNRIIILLIFGLSITTGFSQEFSKHSLSYEFGLGLSSVSNFSGKGYILNIGYKRDLIKDRLRLNHKLIFGSYWNEKDWMNKDQYFNVTSLNLSIDYDLLRYKSISLNVESGGFIGATKGLNGTGNEFDSGTSTGNLVTESEFVFKLNYGVMFAGGIRISPVKSRYAIKIIPLNIKFGENAFFAIHPSIGLDIKL